MPSGSEFVSKIAIIGIPSLRRFDEEVKKYCYMWREGGQFSTEKYKSKDELETKLN